MLKVILLSLLGCIAVVGCSEVTKQNPPTNHNMLCQDIRNNLAFSKTDPTFTNDWDSPTQNAQLLREYRKYNCDNKP